MVFDIDGSDNTVATQFLEDLANPPIFGTFQGLQGVAVVRGLAARRANRFEFSVCVFFWGGERVGGSRFVLGRGRGGGGGGVRLGGVGGGWGLGGWWSGGGGGGWEGWITVC